MDVLVVGRRLRLKIVVVEEVVNKISDFKEREDGG